MLVGLRFSSASPCGPSGLRIKSATSLRHALLRPVDSRLRGNDGPGWPVVTWRLGAQRGVSPAGGFWMETRMTAALPHSLDSRLRGNDGDGRGNDGMFCKGIHQLKGGFSRLCCLVVSPALRFPAYAGTSLRHGRIQQVLSVACPVRPSGLRIKSAMTVCLQKSHTWDVEIEV